MAAPDSSILDFQNMLAGNGGSQVDAILYLISEGMLLRPHKLVYSYARYSYNGH